VPHKAIRSDQVAPPKGWLSPVIQLGNLLFVSGQVGRDPQTRRAVPGGVVEETKQIFKNMELLLNEAGSSLQKIVKTTCFLRDFGDFQAFNETYKSFFPTSPPARTCVQATLGPGYSVEIEAVAYVEEA
jgi:2-iminobutanoate/2-iminopropanoate deaminase